MAIVRTNPNRKTTTSSGGGGSSKKTYNEKEDYQALINEAVKNNDYSSAAKYEQLRNQKIIGEGLNTPTTSEYISHLNGWDTGGSSTPSGGNSQYTGGGNSQYTGSNYGKVYDSNVDYQAKINEAVNSGDWYSAAMYEQLRNQKILGEGLDMPTTNLYGNYLNGYTSQQNQSDALSEALQYMQEYMANNQKPAEPERDPRIDQMLSQILNRDKFSYDAMNDPLYEQYRQAYLREGDRAMRETLAEAASNAGGMNSWAITAAQQANNYYNSQLNDKIPELYQLAYDKYLKDIDNQVRDLGLLQEMDETQYNRYRNTMNDWQNDKGFAYGLYNDAVNQGNWQTTHDYNSMWDNINYLTNNSRYNQEWNANQSQIDLENSRYDTEKAEKQLLAVIESGVMPNDELIQKAGWDKATVEQLVQAAIADKNKPSGNGTRTKDLYRDDDEDDDDNDNGQKYNVGSPFVSNDEEVTLNYSPFESLVDAGGVYQDVQLILAQKGRDAALAYLNDAYKTGTINLSAYNMIRQQYLK